MAQVPITRATLVTPLAGVWIEIEGGVLNYV